MKQNNAEYVLGEAEIGWKDSDKNVEIMISLVRENWTKNMHQVTSVASITSNIHQWLGDGYEYRHIISNLMMKVRGSFLPAANSNLNYFWTACGMNLKLYDFF